LIEEKLSSFLKTGKDWSRFKTNVPGEFVLKLQNYRSYSKRLKVERNPDEEGKSMKRRELILRSSSELEDFKEIFQDNKHSKVLSASDAANPRTKTAK
jgi:hypothetical protein